MARAIELKQWERLSQLQLQWQQAVELCVQKMIQELDKRDAAEKVQVLMRDIQEKTQLLQLAVDHLQQHQQQDLARLKQAQTYLRAK
jgi:hypothetical protein